MKYINNILISALFFITINTISFIYLGAFNTHEIADEIENLKQTDSYIKMRLNIEDQNVKEMLDDVQRAKLAAMATENKKFKQFFFNIFPIGGVAKAITAKGLVGLDETQAPKLHAMIEEIAVQLKMPKPFVFMAFDKKLYNAAAFSLSPKASLILIGEKLLKEMDDQQLKAILAHELGHIHHNHVPKRLLLQLMFGVNLTVLYGHVLYMMWSVFDENKFKNFNIKTNLIWFASLLTIEALIIYLMPKIFREQEREADNAAINTAGAQAFVDAMEKLKQHTLNKQSDFNQAYDFLKQNIEDLEKISPYWAGRFKKVAEAYKNALEEQYKKIIESGAETHPALNERVNAGKELLAEK